MTREVAIRIADLPRKPAEDSPCNGRGLCCAISLCHAAELALNRTGDGPCPFMEWDAGRFYCGLVRTEAKAKMEPLIAKALGIGLGCSMVDDPDDISMANFMLAQMIAQGETA